MSVEHQIFAEEICPFVCFLSNIIDRAGRYKVLDQASGVLGLI